MVASWISLCYLTIHVNALEKEMATHSSVLAWRIPGIGEPGGLLSTGSHRVGHDWSDLAAAAAFKDKCLFLPEGELAGCQLILAGFGPKAAGWVEVRSEGFSSLDQTLMLNCFYSHFWHQMCGVFPHQQPVLPLQLGIPQYRSVLTGTTQS